MCGQTFAIAAALSVLALGSSLNVVRANPLADNLFNSGVDKYTQGDHQGAITDYTKAIKISPQYASAYENRGIDREKINNLEAACRD